jgi:hypothetical protein
MTLSRLLAIALTAVAMLPPIHARAEESPRAPNPEELKPTAEEINARLGWWREARFGMFVHWGISSTLGGSWQGKRYGSYAEHIQRMAKIPIPVYHKEVAGSFNPVAFNADEWIKLAKETGMGYFIITAKHHDGFAMYDSKVSDATVVKMTPFARDPMKELKAACQKYGLKFGFYYSHAFDWGEENGPGNDWDFNNPGGDKTRNDPKWWLSRPDFLPKARKYVDEKAIPQLQELIANYDPDILWFDTPHKLPPEENLRILAAVRKAKPSLVINGRLVRNSSGNWGDYLSTADRAAEFSPQAGDWEGIPTTNESYGYSASDFSHKPSAHFIRLLAKAAARGGNQLVNMGPMGNGAVDPLDVAILQGIGKWWAVNGESIRGTTRTPLAPQAWGQSTRKGDRLYLHVFDWPSDGKLVVGGLKTPIKKASLLADPAEKLDFERSGLDQVITLPQAAPDAVKSVVVIDFVSEPAADPVRVLSPRVPVDTLHVFDGKLVGGLKLGPGKKTDDVVMNWKSSGAAVVWPVRVNETTAYEVSINYIAPEGSKTAKVVEGDEGKETTRAGQGARGSFVVNLGSHELSSEIKQGKDVEYVLGEVTLKPGEHEIRVEGVKITGEELMQLRKIMLKPLPNSKTP